ncbi:MAG TPA: SDR family oxidoreductase [Acidobacteriaceae bacterium]|nr:SDR family oxidoreductase [Acidobacteriaceae bacterium]
MKPVAVITGASSGIGLEFARKLAKTHDLVLVARRLDRLEEAKAELEKDFGAQVEVMVADLTDDSDLAAVEAKIAGEQRLGLLVNNAGIGLGVGPFWEKPLAAHEQMFKLHVIATMRLSHAALGNLVAKDEGGVINVASVAGFLVRPCTASYSTTKAWITSFTEALSLDLRAVGSRVRVQALCPGFTYTEFHDVLKVDRKRVADEQYWMKASDVVDASLAGFAKGKLVVVPGWRYKALVGVLGSLPRWLRQVAIEVGTGKK